jgi:hypothetical protein
MAAAGEDKESTGTPETLAGGARREARGARDALQLARRSFSRLSARSNHPALAMGTAPCGSRRRRRWRARGRAGPRLGAGTGNGLRGERGRDAGPGERPSGEEGEGARAGGKRSSVETPPTSLLASSVLFALDIVEAPCLSRFPGRLGGCMNPIQALHVAPRRSRRACTVLTIARETAMRRRTRRRCQSISRHACEGSSRGVDVCLWFTI